MTQALYFIVKTLAQLFLLLLLLRILLVLAAMLLIGRLILSPTQLSLIQGTIRKQHLV